MGKLLPFPQPKTTVVYSFVYTPVGRQPVAPQLRFVLARLHQRLGDEQPMDSLERDGFRLMITDLLSEIEP